MFSAARTPRSASWAVVAAAVAASLALAVPGASAGTAKLPAPPVAPAPRPTVLDPIPPYVGQNTCDPVVQPGVKAFADLLLDHYGRGKSLGIVRSCAIGGESEHKEGRAFDWGLNAFNAADKAAAESFTTWLAAGNAENARRVGIMYVIWNRRIWSAARAGEGWRPYSGASAHTDHAHISFSWPGAKQETSFWTGKTSLLDFGPCARYAGHPAPLRTGPNLHPCPPALASPVVVDKPMFWYGASSVSIKLAQARLGLPLDGSFGSRTRQAVLDYQRSNGLPITGALDPVTWAKLVPATVVKRVVPTPTPTPTTTPTTPKPTPKPTPTPKTKPTPKVTPKPKPKPKPAPKPAASPLRKYKSSAFRVGSRGAGVRELQKALRLSARYRTGYFGTLTQTAVKRFQTRSHLRATGRMDRRTWDALERRVLAGR